MELADSFAYLIAVGKQLDWLTYEQRVGVADLVGKQNTDKISHICTGESHALAQSDPDPGERIADNVGDLQHQPQRLPLCESFADAQRGF